MKYVTLSIPESEARNLIEHADIGRFGLTVMAAIEALGPTQREVDTDELFALAHRMERNYGAHLDEQVSCDEQRVTDLEADRESRYDPGQ